MYIYVPDRLAARPPILVASHHCQGTGPGTFNETRSSLVPLADANGFIMIFPEATGHNCWDVGSAKSLEHDGGGDTHAIAQMVRYTTAKYGADSSRVYAFGGSSGGMMTQALMGVYPDLFRAGVAVSGVPCGCWAVGYSGDTGSAPQWSGPCAGGNVIKTGPEWGDVVRATFPGYAGPRPRLQLWHGTADTLISYKNQGEAIKEWSNVLGLSETPSSTDTSTPGYTHKTWKGACDDVVLETWDAQGVGHGVNWSTSVVARFLGLDDPNADPGVNGCGAGGASGAGGAGSGGVAPNAGGTGATGGATPSTGGASSGAGGFGSLGGYTSMSAGSPPVAGASSSAGGSFVGSSGGSSGGPGIPQAPTGGAESTVPLDDDRDASSGCNCALAGDDTGPSRRIGLALAGLGFLLRRRRERRVP
jgi:poly(hydroxyalkanoate) depolymerase family esterase